MAYKPRSAFNKEAAALSLPLFVRFYGSYKTKTAKLRVWGSCKKEPETTLCDRGGGLSLFATHKSRNSAQLLSGEHSHTALLGAVHKKDLWAQREKAASTCTFKRASSTPRRLLPLWVAGGERGEGANASGGATAVGKEFGKRLCKRRGGALASTGDQKEERD